MSTNFLDKTNIPIAITNSERFDLSHQHITTANWMQLNPIMCKEMVPGEKCDVNLLTFSRMQPLAVPTFGRANIKERSFFVPMRTIWRAWTDFITDTNHIYSNADPKIPISVLTSVPTVSNLQLITALATGSINWPYASGEAEQQGKFLIPDQSQGFDPSTFDIRVVVGPNSSVKYKLSSYGRQFIKILESLGYKLVWDYRNTEVYSALPLLALLKIVLDWYYPSQYANTGEYVGLMGLLNQDADQVRNLTSADVIDIARVCMYSNYDADYFTSAWDTPVAPAAGLYSSFKFVDITNNATNIELVTNDSSLAGSPSQAGNKPTNGTPFIGGSANGLTTTGVFTQYVDTALHLLNDYLTRHRLSGGRSLDRYLSRFGKALNSEKMNRSNYIGSKMVPLQIGDVMSTSNMPSKQETFLSGLGEFGGKGLAFEKNFSFNWVTDEYGYLIVLSSIIPAADIWQGLNRQVKHISKTDFFTPEFDNLGVQALSTRELFNTWKDTAYMSYAGNSYMSFEDNVFGFTPRYGEYKVFNSQLTGDFMCDTLNVGNSKDSAWHLMRTFSYQDFYDGSSYYFNNMTHNRAFLSGISDHYQYNRIFTYMAPEEENQPDPFTLIYDFQMVSIAPMKSLYENYDWCDADEGRRVTQENNGVKVN